ncbi:Rossmann fold nucleotide-binding protein [Ornithinimicrobium ciconiae]|uniref:Rossmann fold nucleotide-binding protein n=1 Tax=Ornithinimicrobium ciconiae TaxID=2594265 RepID=A0A516GC72_9MICO|nr:LOG family protein [Ornithinimicrobium ciconiae]QDO89124.1 Rossmann fold nucleotide-binding protein [Ornithinimicrobium ciconiae]
MHRAEPPHREVRYSRALRTPMPGVIHEVSDLQSLDTFLEAGASLRGSRLQGLDLSGHEAALLAREDLSGVVVLGGVLTPALEHHLRTHGAIIFPTDPSAPVRPYRGSLYTAAELYDGLAQHGYGRTTDARAYAWLQDAAIRHDAYVTVLRAIHDDAIADALVDVVSERRVVGVMGGHALARGSAGFAEAAHLGHTLAEAGYVVATGGGPGAMEAANLGAWCREEGQLAPALERLSAVPHFVEGIGPWAQVALDIVEDATGGQPPAGPLRSLGIPTWHYGHEPPNVFGDLIAKFFSNALREDLLLHHSTAGLVVLPGAAGTVQEIFQMATRQYYEVDGRVPSVVLVGREHWTAHLPVHPLLQALGRDRPMAAQVHLVDTVEEAAALLG